MIIILFEVFQVQQVATLLEILGLTSSWSVRAPHDLSQAQSHRKRNRQVILKLINQINKQAEHSRVCATVLTVVNKGWAPTVLKEPTPKYD